MARSETLGREHETDLPQGRIRYRVTGPEDAPVLVFVHGFMVNGDLWRNVVPELSTHYRCVTPDLPFGAHEPPLAESADLSLPGLARILADLLTALDLRDVTLIGNDSGGAVVQYVAAEYPDRLSRIVLTPCDAFDNYPPRIFRYLAPLTRTIGVPRLLIRTLRLRPAQRLPIAWGWFAKRPIAPEAMRSYLDPSLRRTGVRRNLRDLILAMDPVHTERAAQKLAGFNHPALVAWTEKDPLFPSDHGRRLAELLPAGRLVRISDSYGAVPEDRPHRLAGLIAEFLTATTSERS